MNKMIKYLDLKAINEPYVHAADKVLQSGWYLKGDYTSGFESAYDEYIGTKYCIGCGNGLDALTLIFRAYIEMGVMQEGDEVLVPANTYIASILAITENRLVPVFVEPDINTLQINDSIIEQAITERTRAIMIVHLYGRCAYTNRIGDICRKHHFKLIEDNAQAHGCKFEGRRTGSLGDAAGHSFYPTKNLGAFGDAGAITTDDAELSEVVIALGNYVSEKKYVFDYHGLSSRIDEIQAAILLAKLHCLDADNQRRKEIAAYYEKKISNPLVRITLSNRDSVYHILPVFSSRRDDLQRFLADNGIGTQIHYPVPPHKQKCYKELNALSLPITEKIHREELSIPCYQAMTDEDTTRVISLLNAFE